MKQATELAMQMSYKGKLNDGKVQWLDSPPPAHLNGREVFVIFTVLPPNFVATGAKAPLRPPENLETEEGEESV
jgi:hypothetical protein